MNPHKDIKNVWSSPMILFAPVIPFNSCLLKSTYVIFWVVGTFIDFIISQEPTSQVTSNNVTRMCALTIEESDTYWSIDQKTSQCITAKGGLCVPTVACSLDILRVCFAFFSNLLPPANNDCLSL